MGITELLIEHITHWISVTGYAGVVALMALESMVAPVPSEAVMPFAGFLVYEKQFTLLGVAFWSTVGSIIGSLLSYYMGYYGGRPFVTRFGKYLLLTSTSLSDSSTSTETRQSSWPDSFPWFATLSRSRRAPAR